MEQINGLILYSDWLMFTRGKIEPRVGDKLRLGKDILIVDYEHLTIFRSFGLEHTFNHCYVEIPYPIIEWEEEDYNDLGTMTTCLKGCIGNFSIGYILYPNNSYCILNYNNKEDFEGTLEELKLKANQLLYGITE